MAQFNDSMASFVSASLKEIPGTKELWVVGERVQLLLSDDGFTISKLYPVPNDINAVTPLVTEILNKSRESQQKREISTFIFFIINPNLYQVLHL